MVFRTNKQHRRSKIVLYVLILLIFDRSVVSPLSAITQVAAATLSWRVIQSVSLACSAVYSYATQKTDSLLAHTVQKNIEALGIAVPAKQVTQSIAPVIQTTYTAPKVHSVPNTVTIPTPAIQTQSINTQADTQKAQALYYAVPEQERAVAEQLVKTISIDWQKTTAQAVHDNLRTVYGRMNIEAARNTQRFEQSYTKVVTDNGVTYRTPDGKGYFHVGVSQRQDNTPLAFKLSQHRHAERLAIHNDPERFFKTKEVIDDFVKNAQQLVYGDIAQRSSALLNIRYFNIPGISYGNELRDTIYSLYQRYYQPDGSINVSALQNMEPARKILLHYHGFAKQHRDKFLTAPPAASAQPVGKPQKLAKKFFNLVYNNENEICQQVLSAFSSGNMEQVRQLKSAHAKSPTVTELCNGLHEIYTKTLSRHEAMLKDAHGIYHFNLPVEHRDPLFTALSLQERTALQKQGNELAQLNDHLTMRHFLKEQLHQAWNIPHNAPAHVHRALYQLLDHETLLHIPSRIDKIHALVSNPALSTTQQTNLMQAFYLPNGVIKDFAEYDRVKTLALPKAIHTPEHLESYRMLNHLLYQERMPTTSDLLKKHVTANIDYLSAALNESDNQMAAHYMALAQEIYSAVTHNETSRIGFFNLAHHYAPNTEQHAIHKDLIGVLAALQRVDSPAAVAGSATPAELALARSLQEYKALAHAVHALNQEGKTSEARALLTRGLRDLRKHTKHFPTQDATDLFGNIIDHSGRAIDDPTKMGTPCGTGLIIDRLPIIAGECLPGLAAIDHLFPEVPENKEERLKKQFEEPNPTIDIVEPKPCGFANQTLPGFGSEDTVKNDDAKDTQETDAGAEQKKPESKADTGDNADNEPKNKVEPAEDEVAIEKPSGTTVVSPPESIAIDAADAQVVAANPAMEGTTPAKQKETKEEKKARKDAKTAEYDALVKFAERLLKENKNLSEKQRAVLRSVINEYKHKASCDHCRDHDQVTKKGWHQLEMPTECQPYVISPTEWAKLIKVFDGIPVKLVLDGYEVKLTLNLDYEHFLGPVFKVHCETGKLEVKGFHHDYLEQAQKGNVIRFELISEKDAHGIYKAEWAYGISATKNSTFFPAHWTPTQVIEKIYEALNNVKETTSKANNRWEIRGQTKEEINILIVVEVDAQRSVGTIITAHPLLNKSIQ